LQQREDLPLNFQLSGQRSEFMPGRDAARLDLPKSTTLTKSNHDEHGGCHEKDTDDRPGNHEE
jgi:hypothetical protein